MTTKTALQVGDYIIERCEMTLGNSLTQMQLLKLVYISHGHMLGFFKNPLIKEDVWAWPYGPVVPELYEKIKHYKANTIGEGLLNIPQEFDEQETSVMNLVCDIYSDKSGIALSKLTHKKDSPWYQTWHPDEQKKIIPNDIIEDYYAKNFSF